MTATQMVNWISVWCKGAWKKHQVTFGLICFSVFTCRRLSITAIGRSLPTATVPKHAIKRVDRWLGNRRFNDKKAREQFLRLVVGQRRQIEIAIDWTRLRSWPVLVAAMIRHGRAIPVLWSVADPQKLYKSQNAFEHGFLTWLKATLPKGVHCVILMDRGFKRVELVNVLRRLDFSFVIRTGGNVHVVSESYRGRIDQWWISRQGGSKRRIIGAILRPSRPVCVNIVGVRRKGCKEPWILMTDLHESIERITARYGRRFQIEEAFRDEKSWRFGLQLGNTLVRQAARVERWLLVASVVQFIALVIGEYARHRGLDRGFRANTVKCRRTHSDFTLGMYFVTRLSLNRTLLLNLFFQETSL
jgi:hypothetical protein